jgi:uncharacterized protein YxeA
MKTTLLSLALLVGVAVTFTNCKKDKDDQTNYFTHDGKTYQTNYAQNTNDAGYSNFAVASADYSSSTYSGKINVVAVDFKNEAVTAGTYTFKDESAADFDASKNFSDANAVIDLIFKDGQPDTSEATLFENITAGMATITKEGSNVTITYDLDFNGKKITGKYSGSVKQIN